MLDIMVIYSGCFPQGNLEKKIKQERTQRKKGIKGKRGGKREEKKEIVVKKRENILILFPCSIQIGPYDRQKSPQENSRGVAILYTPAGQ